MFRVFCFLACGLGMRAFQELRRFTGLGVSGSKVSLVSIRVCVCVLAEGGGCISLIKYLDATWTLRARL